MRDALNHETTRAARGADANNRAARLVEQMTMAEKVQLVTGYIGVALPEDPEERAASSPFAQMRPRHERFTYACTSHGGGFRVNLLSWTP